MRSRQSQACLDFMWADHFAAVHAPICAVPGCQNLSTKCCPICVTLGVDFRVCSQTCLDRVWPSHSLVHAQDTDAKIAWHPCSATGCPNPAKLQCPTCLSENKPGL